MNTWINVFPRTIELQAAGGNFRFGAECESPIVITKCVDCKTTLDASIGDTKEIIEKYTICERCQNKRNGIKLASTAQDLGIS